MTDRTGTKPLMHTMTYVMSATLALAAANAQAWPSRPIRIQAKIQFE